MTRRCSICSSSGHSKRTCSTRKAAAGEGGVRLFGVRLTDGSSVKKSSSMGNLSHCSSAGDDLPEGYHSDDPALGSASARRETRRKKAIPWTIEEHRQFLVGLEIFGKGDWRSISRNYVPSKTPSQVASHAQKYFLHQSNAAKRKRRSLFDIVQDMDTNSSSMPQQFSFLPLSSGIGNEKLTMSSSRESYIKNPVHSLDLSLKPVIMPLPFQLWPPTSSSFKNDPKEPGKELVGISQLTLEETKTVKIEPLPLSLRQPGEP
ncbi:hypothetical protein RD792_012929 [Penstemon davidsonii]|uniref:Uncharacterized protein n=1 Tax=Penstemon davidsonii TaxID=160366 RepID=A0ABR0CY95_9LAMI|nr:hypothetical protein RD792_012929 [Penstemon davidsonii]